VFLSRARSTFERPSAGIRDRNTADRNRLANLAPEQRAEALRIGRIGFASAGAKRKPKEAIAA
jgi:hypothetical protein